MYETIYNKWHKCGDRVSIFILNHLVRCWKHVGKNLSLFMDLCDDSLYAE